MDFKTTEMWGKAWLEAIVTSVSATVGSTSFKKKKVNPGLAGGTLVGWGGQTDSLKSENILCLTTFRFKWAPFADKARPWSSSL